MTDCPPRLRGDLSKWLQEVNAGVYVGNVSGRVRDAIWDRVCRNLNTGRATMVFSANNEQRMDFRVHNTAWAPVDYEGLRLIRRPLPGASEPEALLRPGFSKAAKRQMAQRRRQASAGEDGSFVIIDLETTGLRPLQDRILEFGAVRVRGGEITDTFTRLVRQADGVPAAITALTGIDEENVLIGMYIRKTWPKIKVITKVNRTSFQSIIDSMDLGSVFNPRNSASNLICRYVRAMQNSESSSQIETLYKLVGGKAEALEFRVSEGSKLCGVPLQELRLRENLLIGCIGRGGKIIIPSGQDTIEPGDSVIVVTCSAGLGKLEDILARGPGHE